MTPSTSSPDVIVDLACENPQATAGAYETVLGGPVGSESTRWAAGLGNVVLCLRGMDETTGAAEPAAYFSVAHFRGAHFRGAHFYGEELPDARRLLTRRGYPVVDSALGVLGETIPLGVATPPLAAALPAGDLTGMDHLVFMCEDRNLAVAVFGGTFGLDFRLDQPIGDGARQLFFRAGSVIVEVVSAPRPPDAPSASSPITLWGLAWRSADVDATHARLSVAGLDLSEIRTGRKRGTRIFTVRDRTLGIRTVVIGSDRPATPAG
ncbi:VOC family protein [Gordonia sp. zg691]|uniref:VOC family protein n=1 Tax=Gordonia jinghuaiqii TaxID=2758710 RepID=A0A7D7LP59_9ACTN|nr:VOC family protein [Gordonia jinghuaiqii]MBD0862420.1 VOC family protein [Gordonia jinghuaiqii]MCR5976525.1 hypothetical protein [Gordonia jinghuaiqii]QMS99722.1 VOC family protein [Gordonia jinghuaiqii]